MQTQLFDEIIEPKTIRDLSYHKAMQNPETSVQRNVIHKIIQGHPEGITDLEICLLTGFSRSSVNARRNEIPDVCPVGYAKIVDEYGDRLNTLWGIDNK
jgi:hypothetical protein